MQAQLQLIRARAPGQLQLFRAGTPVDCKHGRYRMQVATGTFREVLPQKPIRVFLRAALPGMLRIAEVDHEVGGHGEALVVDHLLAPVPRQRSLRFLRQLAGMPDQEGVDDGLGILAGNLHQLHEPGLTFDERCNLAVCAAKQQIAFPMARYCAVFSRRRAFANRSQCGIGSRSRVNRCAKAEMV